MTSTNKFGVKVGDIYSASWGYDETHVSFYEVVRVTATKAEVLPIGSVDAPEGGGVIANPDYVRAWDVLIGVNRESEKRTKLCTVKTGYKGEPTIVLRAGQHWAYKWDGKAEYQTPSWAGR